MKPDHLETNKVPRPQDGRADPDGYNEAALALTGCAQALDTAAGVMANQVMSLANDRNELVELAIRWQGLAIKLEQFSPVLAADTRKLIDTLASLEISLAEIAAPFGALVGAVGRTADLLNNLEL
jgi:hypothetical protein